MEIVPNDILMMIYKALPPIYQIQFTIAYPRLYQLLDHKVINIYEIMRLIIGRFVRAVEYGGIISTSSICDCLIGEYPVIHIKFKARYPAYLFKYFNFIREIVGYYIESRDINILSQYCDHNNNNIPLNLHFTFNNVEFIIEYTDKTENTIQSMVWYDSEIIIDKFIINLTILRKQLTYSHN